MCKRRRRIFVQMAWPGPAFGLIIAAMISLLSPGTFESKAFFEVRPGNELRSDGEMMRYHPDDSYYVRIAALRMKSDEYLKWSVRHLDLVRRWGVDENSAMEKLRRSVAFENVRPKWQTPRLDWGKGEPLGRGLLRWWNSVGFHDGESVVMAVRRSDRNESLEITRHLATSFGAYCEVLENRSFELDRQEHGKAYVAAKAAVGKATEVMDELSKQGEGIDPFHGMSAALYSAACAKAIAGHRAATERFQNVESYGLSCGSAPLRFDFKSDRTITADRSYYRLMFNSAVGVVCGFLLFQLLCLPVFIWINYVKPSGMGTFSSRPALSAETK